MATENYVAVPHDQQKAVSPPIGSAFHRHNKGLVRVLSLPLQHLPPSRAGPRAILRRGRRRGWLLQLLFDIDRFAAFGVEHDVERLDALLLPGQSRSRRTIAEQRWCRPVPLLLGLLLQLAQPIDARLDRDGEPRAVATQLFREEQLPR